MEVAALGFSHNLKNWSVAEVYCTSQEEHVASIHNSGEATFVHNFCRKQTEMISISKGSQSKYEFEECIHGHGMLYIGRNTTCAWQLRFQTSWWLA
ncbi:hypothetical protein AALO_G00267180 [Alosa alosa]|uniref:Uncharacterized protein n=1 Tax=Alosa alosa TaxID=278164 RepID=A0AAV6FLC8_9TELE|nr:hypothetical protein AALO_G00267180 [Alosa alosa]